MESNRPELKKKRKHLRNHSTPAEIELWKYLKRKQISLLKFRRQHSVGHYILDFYCSEIKLGIELDGECHIYTEAYDTKRENYIKSKGINILRYENSMVFEHPEVILEEIKEFYDKNKE